MQNAFGKEAALKLLRACPLSDELAIEALAGRYERRTRPDAGNFDASAESNRNTSNRAHVPLS
ncbi:hypothetical protein CR152_31415 [Massilia violaceinigra]|uniref:Uncharacterized protein n=1 Tax=Massilia violaceinigra TaxID=2045208 RepID=A0A2D2DU71_9BURK|nr:hypothetical protein CR152_31415 [Massilia violaceinigra]